MIMYAREHYYIIIILPFFIQIHLMGASRRNPSSWHPFFAHYPKVTFDLFDLLTFPKSFRSLFQESFSDSFIDIIPLSFMLF